MSYGLTACILIRLDGRMGEWVKIADLASHLNVAPAMVRNELEEIVRTGLAHIERDAGGQICQARIDMAAGNRGMASPKGALL